MTALVERTSTFVPARQLPNGSCFYSEYGSFAFQADCVAECAWRTAPENDSGHLVVYDTGCIHGDAEIMVNRGGKGFRMPLRDVVHKFNGGAGRGGPRWDLNIPTYVAREADDGTIRLGKLVGAWDSGRKTTYTVTTETGRTVRATDEHPFLTERGWLRLDELVVGDLVHVRGQQAAGKPRKPKVYYQEVAGLRHHPHATRRTVKNSPYRVFKHRLVVEAGVNGLSVPDYIARLRTGHVEGLTFLDPEVWAVHHIDHDHRNNHPANLKLLTHAEHHALHADEGKTESVLFKVAHERVASIERYGEERTFDLEVADDPHNFLADGFVVHNTGKTIIALATAAFLFEDDQIDQVVVVAERNVIEDWHEAAQGFTNLGSTVYHGAGREKRLAKSGVPHVLVSTYETLAAELVDKPKGKRTRGGRSAGPLMETLGLQAKRTLWVFDEVTKLRNRSSGLYRDWDWLLNTGLARGAPHQRRLGLTATPMTVDMSDGYNIARFLCPEVMPTISEFEREFVSGTDPYGRPIFDADAEHTFAARFQRLTSRKRKTDPDVAPYFPAQHESAKHVRFNRAQREFYETVATIFDPPPDEEDPRTAQEYQNDNDRLWNLVRMTAGHPGAHLHAENDVSQTIAATMGAEALRGIGSPKVAALLATMRPFHERGWPVVVFSFYKTVLTELALELDAVGLSYVQFHGGQTQRANEKAKKTFMLGDTQVFLASDAAARGMNLQVSPAVVEYESALTYDKRVQRINRVSRLTSPWSDVYCRTLVVDESVEEGILALALKRNARQDLLLGDQEDGSGFIAADTRREMLQVRRRR